MSLDFKSLIGAGSESGGIAGNAAQSAMGIDTGCLPSLTLKQRVIAFSSCFGIGMVISLLSTIAMAISLTMFAVLYTLGNIIALFRCAARTSRTRRRAHGVYCGGRRRVAAEAGCV